jgi:hypothetical protein
MDFTITTEDLVRDGALALKMLAVEDGARPAAYATVAVAKLAADHPVRRLLPADQLLWSWMDRLLVLGPIGPDGRPFVGYSADAAKSLTIRLSDRQRRAAADADPAFVAKLKAHGCRDIGGGMLGRFAKGFGPAGSR